MFVIFLLAHFTAKRGTIMRNTQSLIIALVIGLNLCANPGKAQQPAKPDSTAAPIDGLFGENVLTPLPKGFKLGSTSTSGPFSQMEYIPEAETVHDWSIMLTVNVLRRQLPISPDAYSEQLAQGFKRLCAHGDGKKLTNGEVNGYAYTQWEMTCDLNPMSGKPEFMISRSIQGKDAFYNVQYAFRALPTPELEQQAITYMNTTSVCDTRLPDQACKLP